MARGDSSVQVGCRRLQFFRLSLVDFDLSIARLRNHWFTQSQNLIYSISVMPTIYKTQDLLQEKVSNSYNLQLQYAYMSSVHSSKHRSFPILLSSAEQSWQYTLAGVFIPSLSMLTGLGLCPALSNNPCFSSSALFLGSSQENNPAQLLPFSHKNLKQSKY